MSAERKYSFSKRERIYLNREVNALRSLQKGFISYPLRVVYLSVPRQDVGAKVLITVAKKRVRHAHDRNRIKRYIRESYRLAKYTLVDALADQPTTLLVHFMYIGAGDISHAAIQHAVNSALEKIVTLIKPDTNSEL